MIIVCGDDQNELFSSAHMPSIAVYYGETIRNLARPKVPPADWYARAQSIRQEPCVARDYPCDAGLARAIIEGLMVRGFDPSSLSSLPPGQGRGARVLVRAQVLSAGWKPSDRADLPQHVLSAEPAGAGALRGARRSDRRYHRPTRR